MVNDYKSVHSQGASQPPLDVSNLLEIENRSYNKYCLGTNL